MENGPGFADMTGFAVAGPLCVCVCALMVLACISGTGGCQRDDANIWQDAQLVSLFQQCCTCGLGEPPCSKDLLCLADVS